MVALKANYHVGMRVWKRGGYEGPGVIIAIFQAENGTSCYVVAHEIKGGYDKFYHVYSDPEIEPSQGPPRRIASPTE